MAKIFGVNFVTLQRYIRKSQTSKIDTISFGYAKEQIFSIDEEKTLSDYVKRAAGIYFGLTSIDVRKIALLYAISLKIKVPESWKINEKAGPGQTFHNLKL